MWYFWILGKRVCLLSKYVVFVGLRHSCLLCVTVLLIGLCGAHRWERQFKPTCMYCIVKPWIRETNYTIKSYVHVSIVNEMSDENESGYEG